jgi:hypothetical protein
MKETDQSQFGLGGTDPGVFQGFYVSSYIGDLRFAQHNGLLKHCKLDFRRHAERGEIKR